MDEVVKFLQGSAMEIVKALVLIATAVATIIQQFKKQDK